MIRPEKHDRALEAIHQLLVQVRFMAATHESYDGLVSALDVAEYLPTLFLRNEDLTDHFRETLAALVAKDERFGVALERFDQSV